VLVARCTSLWTTRWESLLSGIMRGGYA